MKKFYYGLEGFNKYGMLLSFDRLMNSTLLMTDSICTGLYRDDLHDYTNPRVLEAVRRLPADVYDAHVFRVIRASQLEFSKQYLPESERPTFEDVSGTIQSQSFSLLTVCVSLQAEANGNFLQPYIQEVEKECQEIDEWHKFLSKD